MPKHCSGAVITAELDLPTRSAAQRGLVRIGPHINAARDDIVDWGSALATIAESGDDVVLAANTLCAAGHEATADALLARSIDRFGNQRPLINAHVERLWVHNSHSEAVRILDPFESTSTERKERIKALDRLAVIEGKLGGLTSSHARRMQSGDLRQLVNGAP